MAEGLHEVKMTVQVIVGFTTDQGSQATLDRYLETSGEYSVKAAIESERPAPCTLGGVVQDLQVTSSSGYRLYPRQTGEAVLGAEWTVVVQV
jgi:hypothetical protein